MSGCRHGSCCCLLVLLQLRGLLLQLCLHGTEGLLYCGCVHGGTVQWERRTGWGEARRVQLRLHWRGETRLGDRDVVSKPSATGVWRTAVNRDVSNAEVVAWYSSGERELSKQQASGGRACGAKGSRSVRHDECKAFAGKEISQHERAG